ncbi:MAG TPA: hypothetical protein VM888_03440 [Chitinophagaceae bacterium]|nr:hypothetical protein [Chitinophagaceae bacterium]
MIPEQNTGIATNTESKEILSNIEEAVQFYTTVKERLLHVNEWQSLAGAATASFQLTDSSGMDVNRTVQKGDHFKIDIPGPGPATGDGFDWVQVEEIEEVDKNEEQSIIITVRPATNPNNDRKDVAHFFSAEATSCFMVKREGTTVMAAVYGRNEKPNTNAEKTVDKARNAAVATGAISGFSKLQWKSLVNGLVKQK